MTDSGDYFSIKIMRHPRLARGSGRQSCRHMTHKTRGRAYGCQRVGGHDGGDRWSGWL